METETHKRPPKPKKIETVRELTDRVQRARGIYFTEYKGLTVAQITDLRRQCYQKHVEYLVCKNTFARMVMTEKGYGDILPLLVGPVGMAFAYEDPAVPAKILFDFAAKNEKLVLKGGMFEGKPIRPADIEIIKELPSRDVALSTLIAAIYGPVQGFYNVVNAVLRDFVSVIDQIAEQKKGPGAEPVAE
ncbi:MAG TPA: 50S ribosomal protein L10 [bacterium]|jgi:large subunit ribosomal protein L10